jgi:hypothetical protein
MKPAWISFSTSALMILGGYHDGGQRFHLFQMAQNASTKISDANFGTNLLFLDPGFNFRGHFEGPK